MPKGFIPELHPHGNDKTGKKPFFPTLPSTKKDIESEPGSHGPKRVLATVSQKLGGIQHALSPCELPRNERQVMYIHSKTKSSSHGGVNDPCADQVFAMMQSAKVSDGLGHFVRETRPSPEPAFVLARDRQLDDLVRFCAIPESFSVLTVDPTFNLGEFDVTPTTYRHGLLISPRFGKSPIMIGPIMIHYRKTFHTYLFFASTLVGLRRELAGLRAFGTDGEKALVDAFLHEFHYASHLTCFIHCRRNIKSQLQALAYPECAIKEVLDDIFGCQTGNVFSEGLVDSANEEEFSHKLIAMEARWNQFEKEHGTQPGFFDWFARNKATTITQTMLKPVREEAGLGSPPEPFTTNASEAVNALIKSHVSYKQSQLIELTDKLKEVVDEQEKEVERAVIGRGKYRFKEEYQYLQVAEDKWFKMTPDQRQTHLKKVSAMHVKKSQSVTGSPTSLSVDVQSVSELVKIPLPCIEGIWRKAITLLNSPDAVSLAPGHPDEARMVKSSTGQRPHLVLPCIKGHSFKCDSDCLNYKSLGICSHCVVVAELNNQLDKFVASFTKSKRKLNFTEVAIHGMPAGRGRKGSQPPRKKKRSQPVSERVDRMSVTQSSNQNFPMVSTCMTPGSSDMIPGSSNMTTRLSDMNPGSSYMTSGSSYMTSGPSYMSPGPSYMSPGPSYISLNPPYMTPCHSTYSSLPSSQPMAAPFTLAKIVGNISKCTGCGNPYAKPPVPPNDLCIRHPQWRSFLSPAGNQQCRFSPAYYHVNILCITKDWPYFRPTDLIIPPELLSCLTPAHQQFLTMFGYLFS